MTKKRFINKRNLLYAALGLSTLLLIGWWSSIEWIEEEIDLGYNAEAQRNPLLAAERLLELRNFDVRSHWGFGQLHTLASSTPSIDTQDTVLLAGSYGALTEGHTQALWRWLEQGGHLIALMNNPFLAGVDSIDDPLLERLGLKLHWPSEENEALDIDLEFLEALLDPEADMSTDTDNTYIMPSICHRDDNLEEIRVTAGGPPTAVRFARAPYFINTRPERDTDPLNHSENQLRFVDRAVGAGRVTLLNHSQVFHNTDIECHDHAFLLTQLTSNKGIIWFLQNRDGPNFWRLLWQMSLWAVLALITALLLGLWRAAIRFGPVLPNIDGARRQFMDHIRANGAFLWRHRQQAALCDTLREEVQQRLNKRWPDFYQLSRPKQYQRISELCRLSTKDIDLALHQDIPQEATAFTEMIKLLQHLRNTI